MGKKAEKAAGKPKAVVLCSGGLDSTTVLYHAIHEGFDVYPVSFNYKQRHVVELAFVRKTLEKLGLVD
ncbi:MAG: 7-cyano-7-deazaguanine synthase [Candidatus Sigynarchaeota archaeon]